MSTTSNKTIYEGVAKDLLKNSRLPTVPDTQLIRSLHHSELCPPPRPGMKVLDVGCFDGGALLYFARYGYQVAGADVSDVELKLTENNLNKEGFYPLALRKITDNKLAFSDGEFDVVVCWNTIYWSESLENIRALLSEIRRTLKPGGCAIVSILGSSSINVVNGQPIDGNRYRYIRPDGLESYFYQFRSPQDFCSLLEDMGYTDIRMGSSSGHLLHKPGTDPSRVKRETWFFFCQKGSS